MIRFYYYLVVANAVVALTAGAGVFWKNRFQRLGPLFGATFLLLGLWLIAFAQYFRPVRGTTALWWAYVTLSLSIMNHPFYFHAICALSDKTQRFRRWITVSYVTAAAFLILLWSGRLIAGLRPTPQMDHYIRYFHSWYPLLSLYILYWALFGFGVLLTATRQASGYRRTQLIYFLIAAFIVFLTTDSIILPLEYNVNIQPFGFFVLPINMGFLAYVLSKARMADYNVVIARVLLHTLTLLVVVIMSVLSIAVMTLVAPGFMNAQQIAFTVLQVVIIGLALAVTLPGWLPRAERVMQERLFAGRHSYQDTLGGMVKELSTLPTIDQLLSKVATSLHSQMQVSRVVILTQDLLSSDYKLQAESGLGAQDDAEALLLKEDSAVVKWLEGNRDALVRDEMARRVSPWLQQHLETELNRLRVGVCVPMILDGRLVGIICIGEKLSRDMFFVSDLRLLETLATEIALAVKYRRMEDEVFRKNRLVELGTIAAGVAHEIRNPLASIKTFAQLMPERMEDPEFKNEFSKLVLKDVDRITKVIESMLAFARPSQVNIKEQPSNDLVEEAILLVQPRLKAKRIDLTRAFHGNPVVKVDKHQILQVLVNLLSNAADALQERGKIRVATGMSQRDITGGGNGNRGYAVIEVSDNGPGIPAAVRNRLFDPFFTTKKEGTGLGLSISQKIVRDHGGSITVSSVEGKGTTFQVSLPLQ